MYVSHKSVVLYTKLWKKKLRKFVSHCDMCQSVKRPNRAYEVEGLSHLPKKNRRAIDLGFVRASSYWT
jgi:hypothetical protein